MNVKKKQIKILLRKKREKQEGVDEQSLRQVVLNEICKKTKWKKEKIERRNLIKGVKHAKAEETVLCLSQSHPLSVHQATSALGQ